VQMHESRISVGTGVVVIDGGKLNFVGGGVTGNSLESPFEISNGAKASFSNAKFDLSYNSLSIDKSDASFASTSVYSFSHRPIVVSDSNLSMVDSVLTSGRAGFFVNRSTLSLTRSAVSVAMTNADTAMGITSSKIQASCPGPLVGSVQAIFSGTGNFVDPGMKIYETDTVFTNCSCQTGKAMYFAGPIEINRSSVRYEKCQPSKEPSKMAKQSGAPATTLV
jgi:hypothetical protein